MNPNSFNIKIHSETAYTAKITLAASSGNSDYDRDVGFLYTLEQRVNLKRRVPVMYLGRIAVACENYLGGKELLNE